MPARSSTESMALPPGTTQRTLAVVMGGGAGTRLFPLTKDRSKPAVPLGGKYRLVDIPISNCLNSGLRSIYVLTQFNTMSLHRHIQASYKFDNFLAQLCRHPRGAANAGAQRLVSGNG
jgi:glucose-1-phosphate adenylyltransferase